MNNFITFTFKLFSDNLLTILGYINTIIQLRNYFPRVFDLKKKENSDTKFRLFGLQIFGIINSLHVRKLVKLNYIIV